MRYVERQCFDVWVYGLLLGIIAVEGYASIMLGAWWMFALLIAILLLITNLLFMQTTVEQGELRVRFGWLIPMYWKTIPLDGVAGCEIVTYRPLRDAGGWGIRWGRFGGQSCHYLNARGNRGVLLETAGKRYIIGSQQPEALADYLSSALTT